MFTHAHTHTHTHTLNHTHTHTHARTHTQSALYNEGTQNESLAALETVLSGQRPEPTTQLQEVAVLTRANVELGSVYGDINGLVDPIDLDNALSYTEINWRLLGEYRLGLVGH